MPNFSITLEDCTREELMALAREMFAAQRYAAAIRDECAALRTEAATLRREHAIVAKDLAAARDQRDRYERALKAFAKWTSESCEFGVLATCDALEWVAAQSDEVLDGQEAECPMCGTHIHEGACVGDGGEGDEFGVRDEFTPLGGEAEA